VLDFTSALYLGMRHGSGSLRPWGQLTTGAPAALTSPPGANAVAQKLAALQGCERGILAPSTLHLFWDLFGVLSREKVAIYVDEGIYPIARWGAERAALRGATVRRFPHHNANELGLLLERDAPLGMRPIIVTDGFCPTDGQPAPIAAYLKAAKTYEGCVVMDDTQALGILGNQPEPQAPYGRGGGGMLRWTNVRDPNVIMIASLAKGFGVPVAVLAGCRTLVQEFKERSETRVHCSPPSVAVIHAAEHALAINKEYGDALRQRLAQLVRHFRNRLAEVGLSATGGLFPVQKLAQLASIDARMLHEELLRLGIRTVLHRNHNGHGARIGFIITARHSEREIDRAIGVLAQVIKNLENPRRRPKNEESIYV
jgi:8-amino-7-oxononanoate synthase